MIKDIFKSKHLWILWCKYHDRHEEKFLSITKSKQWSKYSFCITFALPFHTLDIHIKGKSE